MNDNGENDSINNDIINNNLASGNLTDHYRNIHNDNDNNNDDDYNNDRNDSDLVDFLVENVSNFKIVIQNIFYHGSELWRLVPDIVGDIFSNVFYVLNKMYIKMKSYILFELTRDMNRLGEDGYLWKKLIDNNRRTAELFDLLIKLNGREFDKEELGILKKVFIYLKYEKKGQFLKYCNEKQFDRKFSRIRLLLINGIETMESGKFNISTVLNPNQNQNPNQNIAKEMVKVKFIDFDY